MSLFKYQLKSIAKLIKNKFFGLFLDMGLGKTRIVLEAIRYLNISGKKHKYLVIAPVNVCKYVWEQEAQKWKMNFSFIKLIGSPAQRVKKLKKDAQIYLLPTDLTNWFYSSGNYKGFTHVVVDELSMFRNTTSNRFKALKKMRKECELLWGLTGTPAPNGLEKIWGIIFILDQGIRLGKYKKNFENEYLYPDVFVHNRVVKWKLREGADEKIYSKINDICVSVKTEDYIELPDFQTNYIYTEMDSTLMKKYRNFVRDKIIAFEKGDLVAKNPAVLVSKCQQFCNGHTYLDSGEVQFQHSLKLDALKVFLDSCGTNVLLFYNFITDKDYILEHIEGAEELDICKWNEGQQRVALSHPKSGGYGLNLQEGGNIILWFSPIWDLELYQQSIKRIHRRGQVQKVFNYIILMKNTIDERIIKALDKKAISQNELLEMIKLDRS